MVAIATISMMALARLAFAQDSKPDGNLSLTPAIAALKDEMPMVGKTGATKHADADKVGKTNLLLPEKSGTWTLKANVGYVYNFAGEWVKSNSN